MCTYNLDLPLDKISAGDHLGDRMFHLQPRIHLHEIELLIHVHYKLHRACSDPHNKLQPYLHKSKNINMITTRC